MDPHISVVTAMLDSVAYHTGEFDAPVVPEADFVPFNLSYLSDFAGSEKQSENPALFSSGANYDSCGALAAR